MRCREWNSTNVSIGGYLQKSAPFEAHVEAEKWTFFSVDVVNYRGGDAGN